MKDYVNSMKQVKKNFLRHYSKYIREKDDIHILYPIHNGTQLTAIKKNRENTALV